MFKVNLNFWKSCKQNFEKNVLLLYPIKKDTIFVTASRSQFVAKNMAASGN